MNKRRVLILLYPAYPYVQWTMEDVSGAIYVTIYYKLYFKKIKKNSFAFNIRTIQYIHNTCTEMRVWGWGGGAGKALRYQAVSFLKVFLSVQTAF